MDRTLSWIATAAVLLLAAPAAAQQACAPIQSTPHAATNWSTTLRMTRFDPALGSLREVHILLSASVDGTYAVENLAAGPAAASVELSALLTVKRPDGTVLVSTQPAADAPVALAAFDGVLDFAGPSGATGYLLANTGGIRTTLVGPSDLALFRGPAGAPGMIDLPVTAVGTSSVAGGTQIVQSLATSATAGLRICYLYDLPLSFCAGDGSVTACPCGNHSPIGLGAGCLNSTGFGGRLSATGETRLTLDALRLAAETLPQTTTALFFQGTTRENAGLGLAFGDGLRCAGGAIVRLATRTAAGGTVSYPGAGDPPVSTRGLITAPGVRTYQVWYRNAAPFCTSEPFNLTQGIEANWQP